MKKIISFFAPLVFLTCISYAEVWDVTTPTGSDPLSQGDDRVREAKRAVQEALQWSGVFPGTNPATAPMYQWTLDYGLNASTPTASLQDGQIYYATDTYRFLQYRSTGATWNTIAIGASSDSLKMNASTAVFTTGGIISDGNITTTGDDVDFSTHVSIVGNLTVGGILDASLSKVVAISTGNYEFTAGGGTQKVTLASEITDTLSEFNTTYSSFTASTSGYFHIDFGIQFIGSNSSLITVYVYKNGANVAESALTVDSAGQIRTVSLSATLSLSTNDVLNLYAANGSGTVTVLGNASIIKSYLSIYKLQ